MKKAIFLLLILVSCTFTPKLTILTENKAIDINIEVAETQNQRAEGLMNRNELNGGMLFIFTEQQPVSFWMKNTLIPLDMIFISKNYLITDIQQAEPCKKDPCPTYSSTAMYVLEVNEDFCKNNDIKIGDRVSFSV